MGRLSSETPSARLPGGVSQLLLELEGACGALNEVWFRKLHAGRLARSHIVQAFLNLNPHRTLRSQRREIVLCLVSHYSAIGVTISCDAPFCAIGFRAKLFLRYPLVRPILGLR